MGSTVPLTLMLSEILSAKTLSRISESEVVRRWRLYFAVTLSRCSAVFAVALIVVSFFTPLFSSLVQRSALGGLDQGTGFFFGVLRGILLVAIAFFLYNVVMTGQSFTMVDESRSAVVFERMIGKIEDRNPEQALGWVTQQYEALIGSCGS